ncbi:hypothetical protein SSPO_053900 [Streptomyces antimycoticus]|uniref:Transposase n=1 Tax=Streptomyces antimycoticus TaxID=68175 RepID=A0A499UNU8_9ACTN|nr:DUF6262 family protein [Streptomyces antimycoticus]BBJ42672.1 hypothetical protein SSPO_053900 [Streptomyces antimycoticus]
MTASRTPGDVLRESRKRDSREKRSKVIATVDAMVSRDETVTFAGVAKAAGVSNWLVYAEGVREHIEAARQQQAGRPRRDRAQGLSASSASLLTDLELSRAENGRLRAERDQLRQALRRQLGQQLDNVNVPDLVERVRELTAEVQRLTSDLETTRGEKAALERQLEDAGEDLTAARTTLRRMIREKNASAAEGS